MKSASCLIIALSMCICISILSSCASSSKNISDSKSDVDSTSSAIDVKEVDEKKNTTIVDMGGDTITLPETIDRVVSTSDPCTDMLVAFGQGDKLIGAYFRALDNPWFQVFYPRAQELVRFESYEPEAESLFDLNTDIIFVPSQERAASLREKGICAITIRYYTPDEMLAAAKMLGLIFGGEAKSKSEEWIKDFESVRDTMMLKTSDIEESQKPVAYEILADKGRGPFRTYYGDNQAWLSYAGGILATKDYADATSQAMPTEEAILATNPNIIFIGGTFATKEYADLLVDEKWENIDAVKNGNIYIEPTGATAWNSCSTTYPLLVYYCFQCMYPDKVDFNLKEIAHGFYYKYYGIDFTEQELGLMFQSKAPDGTDLWD